MTASGLKIKFPAQSPQEPRVHIWEESGNIYEPASFSLSSIERIKGHGEQASLLILPSVKILVGLPFAVLEDRLYIQPAAGNIIDLRDVTGPALLTPLEIKNPGMITQDGSIYLGHYKDRDWYVAARDAHATDGSRLILSFNGAAQYARNMRAHGHDDWVVPDAFLLTEMITKHDLGEFRGTYDIKKWYWSSDESRINTDKGLQCMYGVSESPFAYRKEDAILVRCVRSVLRKKLPGV